MAIPFNQGDDYWTNPKKIFNRQRYGWTKYDGGFSGLEKEKGLWFCQACGQQQPEEVPRYLMPAISGIEAREWVSICSVCKHKLGKRRISYQKLIRIIRIEV